MPNAKIASPLGTVMMCLSCLIAPAASAAEPQEGVPESWTMLLMTARFSEKLEFPTRDSCTDAAVAMRRLGKIMNYADVFCIGEATSDVVGIDTHGKILETD